jgi:type IV secretory pathway VirD2 relaxase
LHYCDLDSTGLSIASGNPFSCRERRHGAIGLIMAHDDDEIVPRLGRIRSRGSSKRAKRYLHRVLRAIAFAGGRPRGGTAKRQSGFQGNRIGRGAGVGRVLASRDRYAAFRSRRVVVKTRIVTMAGKGLDVARVHLRYIQRDGVTREGTPGELYDAEHDRADGKAFIERSDGDRHQFRFIVTPEDGAEYDDLKDLNRRLMQRAEDDLGTRLDWVAVDHYNTAHPHTHIVIRGKDETGRDLVIAREYLTHGFRERVSELVSLDLGPRTDREIEERLTNEVGQERFTSLDRSLQRAADVVGRLDVQALTPSAREHARFQHALRMGRLRTLERLGLAEEIQPGSWYLSPEMELTLRRLGERGDIIKTLHREMVREGRKRGAPDYAIYDPTDATTPKRLVGRVVARGLSNEVEDRHYLVVDGVDGRTHWVDIGRGDATEATPVGAVVAISPRPVETRTVDRTVAEIAAANQRHYSIELHIRHDPNASQEFAETHVRRLEAMRRARAGVERRPDGSWVIAPDHLDRAEAYERGQARMHPVTVEIISTLPLAQQLGTDGATWLDRDLVAEVPTGTRDAGFGREVREALSRRRQWLVEQELARDEPDRIAYRRDLLVVLRRRELARVATQLSGELGLAYVEPQPGERVEGVYRRRLDLASGRFALIEKSREFTLVPWRSVLERNLGKPVEGIVRGDAISWALGRQRGAPSR